MNIRYIPVNGAECTDNMEFPLLFPLLCIIPREKYIFGVYSLYLQISAVITPNTRIFPAFSGICAKNGKNYRIIPIFPLVLLIFVLFSEVCTK